VKVGDIPFSQAQSRFRKKRASMAAGAPDNQRQTVVGSEEFAWRPQPSSEDHPLETFPVQYGRHHPPIVSVPSMSSMATGTSRTQLSLLDEQRYSLRRDRLSADINRMVLGGRTEPDVSLGLADYTRMRSTHWITRLYSMELMENECVPQTLLRATLI
jgi:hypothetical protein